jgi:hypothetical protein
MQDPLARETALVDLEVVLVKHCAFTTKQCQNPHPQSCQTKQKERRNIPKKTMAPRLHPAALLAAALLVILCPAALLTCAQETDAASPSVCRFVPVIPALDTTPTPPAEYGRCTPKIEPQFQNTSKTPSNWCAAERFETWPPEGPAAEAAQCLKFGRLTVFSGPVRFFGGAVLSAVFFLWLGVFEVHFGETCLLHF